MSLELFYTPIFLGFFLEGLVFFLLGLFMKKNPPKTINSWYGYRTGNSMKSTEIWVFAQVYAAKQLKKVGIIFFILSVIGVSYNYFFNSLKISTAIILFVIITLAVTLFLILKVERKIIKKFP